MARPPAFTVDELQAAGLAVTRRAGWPAASTRGVAAELGVTPMALYRLAPDAPSLRRLIADAAAPAVAVRADEPLGATLRRWAVDAYRQLGEHPLLASYVILEWTELPAWLDVVEGLLAVAAAHGVTGAEAVGVVNAVFAYVLARAQLRDAAATAPQRELAPLAADPARYPHVRANRAEFAVRQIDKHFPIGLDALLRGLVNL
jgi:AcrR family transcriptional regulator